MCMKNESYGDFSRFGAGGRPTAPRKAGGWLRVLVGALGLIAGLGVPAAEAAPAAIILSWDANTEAGLAGYRVRHGVASGTYNQTRDVGNVTEVVLTEMTAGTKYFFVVSAYDALGQEGPQSDEISFIPTAGTAPAPLVSVILDWDANTEAGLAGYRVRHGVASGTYNQTKDVGNVTEVVLTEMTAGTTYYFVVSAYDIFGQEGPLSDEINFTPTAVTALVLEPLPAPPAGDPGLTAAMPTVSDWSGLGTNGFRFVVTAAPGQILTVYASSDMLNWELLGSFSNPTGRFQAIDTAAGTSQTRYYQVVPGGG